MALLGLQQMPAGWDPATDAKVTTWGVVHHLIKRLDTGGEQSAAVLLRQVGGLGDTARDLAYRLYSICERKKWASSALAFNGLVSSWPDILKVAHDQPGPTTEQLRPVLRRQEPRPGSMAATDQRGGIVRGGA